VAVECFCGCGTPVPKFPLGLRSVNKRGRLVLDRLVWARHVFDDQPPEGFEHWYSEGEDIVESIADALHGEVDVRQLDERAIRHWQSYGRKMERVARRYGAPSVLATNAARLAAGPQDVDSLDQLSDTLRDIAATNCAEWPQEGVAAITDIALTGGALIADLADHPELIPVTARAREAAGAAFRDAVAAPLGAEAAVFLAHALIEFEARFFQRLAAETGGDDYAGSAEAYHNVRTIAFSAAFPLDPISQVRLEQVDHAFEVFDNPDGYRSSYPDVDGVPLFLPLTTALELHGLASGDEERLDTLVGTRRTCSWYFHAAAIVHALDLAAGSEWFADEFADEITVSDFGDFDTVVRREALWQEASGRSVDAVKAWLDQLP
jgi:hypothetical protein